MAIRVNRFDTLDLKDKKVLIREDLNVPLSEGKVTSNARIMAALPTIRLALDKGARIMLVSHLGRPEEGFYQEKYSLAPVASELSRLLDREVPLIRNYLEGFDWKGFNLVLLENIRFCTGEADNSKDLARKLAELCDIFVMDAFGTAHRAQASTEGVIREARVACAGPLLVSELEALERALANPERPLLAIVGGSKVSTKLSVLENLSRKTDQLVVGGGIANTFIAASGANVGASLYEPDLIETARQILKNTQIPLPEDVVVAKSFPEKDSASIAGVRTILLKDIEADDMILDLGPKSMQIISDLVSKAGTILWNGPLGVFEFTAFSGGTKELTESIAASKAYSLAGGGDTLAAIDQFGATEQISYISTGGGAFLEFVEGKTLPAVKALEDRVATS